LNAVKKATRAAIVSGSDAPATASSACPANSTATAATKTGLPRPLRSALSMPGSISTTDAPSTDR
jgi:hypothetical protein